MYRLAELILKSDTWELAKYNQGVCAGVSFRRLYVYLIRGENYMVFRKSKKKLPKPVKVILILVVAAAAGTGILRMLGAGGVIPGTEGAAGRLNAAGALQEVLSAEVGRKDISQDVSGTGTLMAEDAKDVIVPAGLEVSEIYVEEGDKVEEGQAIALVSLLSVNKEILSVQESIDDMEKTIKDLSSKEKNYELKKEVYTAQKEDLIRVRDEMRELKNDCVLRSDKAGVVDSLNLYERIETGSQPVSAGKNNSTDKDSETTETTEKNDLTSLRNTSGTEAYSNAPAGGKQVIGTAAVLRLRADGGGQPSGAQHYAVNSAFGDGADVSGESVVEGGDNAASDGEEGNDSAGGNEGVNNTEGYGNGAGGNNTDVSGSSAGGNGNSTGGNGSGSGTEGSQRPGISAPEGMKPITGILQLNVEPPAAGEVPQTELGTNRAEGEDTADDESPERAYRGVIEWIPAGEVFLPETSYAAVITLYAEDGYYFAYNEGETKYLDVAVEGAPDVEFKYLDLNRDGIVETLRVAAFFPETGLLPAEAGDMGFGGYGDIDGGFGGFDGSGTAGSGTGKTYSEAEALAMTVIPDKDMYIDINVDELDILSLEKGQQAKVNIDAIDGQEFEGVISSISNKASGGGNGEAAKYKVRIRVDRADGMMNGMNASAEINVGDRKGALTIPVEAVQSLDEKNIVYTALDEAGMPSEPKEVRLGFSTSTEVEILSGLQEGDMVYYLPTTEDQDEGGYYYF